LARRYGVRGHKEAEEGTGACESARAGRSKVHGEVRELTGHVRVRKRMLAADADAPLAAADNRGSQELVPRGRGNGESLREVQRRWRARGAPSARALATKALRKGGGGKAKRVSRCSCAQCGHVEQAQSGTVNASSASERGSA
jgi:hypothetical protein